MRTFTCGDGGALAGYLYGECDPAERLAIDAHVAVCAVCAAELAALGATRSALAAWTPPDAELGFHVVAGRDADAAPSNVVRPARWWRQPLPAWAQAVAAMVIFAVGALLGMRAGGSSPAPGGDRVATAAASGAQPSAVSAQDLAALEQRLRSELAAVRTAASPSPEALQVSGGDEQLLRRVRALVEESERRQQRELAFRVAQVLRDVDAQRRMDLARIEQTVGRIEGMTAPELGRQRQAIDYLIRTAVQRPQQ